MLQRVKFYTTALLGVGLATASWWMVYNLSLGVVTNGVLSVLAVVGLFVVTLMLRDQLDTLEEGLTVQVPTTTGDHHEYNRR